MGPQGPHRAGRHRPGAGGRRHEAGHAGTADEAAPSHPGEGGGRRLDARLAVPAGVAWALLAAMLGARPIVLAVFAALSAGAAGAAWWRRRSGRRSAVLAACALVSAIVLGAASAQSAGREAGGVSELAAQRAVVTVTGKLTSDPRLLQAGPERRVDQVIVTMSVEAVEGRGSRWSVSTPVLVLAPASWKDRRWWETVTVTGRLKAADPGQDVVAVFTPSSSPRIEAGPGPVADVADVVRGRLREATAGLPDDARGLLPGLVIGDTALAPSRLTEDMRLTGMTHLSAVSGSNVAIVLAAALRLAGLLRLPRRWRPVLAGGLLVAFVVLARPEPSVVRAAVMGGIGLVGLSASRRAAGLPALASAVVVCLLVDPWLARSYGFALSVLATAGLLVFAGPWGRWLAARLPRRLGFLGEAVAIPLAAQLVCAPVIVLLSGSISVVAVLANLLAAPLVAPATVLGVAAALAATVSPLMGSWVAAVAALPVLGIAQVAHRCAAVPYANVPWPQGAPGALLLTVLTALALLAAPRLVWHALRRPVATLAAGGILVGALLPAPEPCWPDPTWRFVACDVGQGDGLVLRSGERSAVVVDTGPEPSAVAGCLRRLGVDRVDAVLLTHLHDDHSGGIEAVLDGWPVGEVFLGPVDDPPGDSERVMRALGAHGLRPQRVGAGDTLRWERLTADVLAPARRIDTGSVPNNNSVVLDVDADGVRLLLLADAEREECAAVRSELAGRLGRGFDVVKVAHHGSANHDHQLLEQTHAGVFVISVGADNDFGHPAPALLGTLAGIGAPVYRTDRDGDVLVGLVDGAPAVAHRR